jgi:hypothetical protein
MFWELLAHLQRYYMNTDLVIIVCHQICIHVVPPEDGQVMPETY